MPVTLTVLYVDDDPDLRYIARLSLALDDDLVIHTAESGPAALALLDDDICRPDIVLLDVVMPQMDGPATLRHIRKRPAYRSTPVVFVSARTKLPTETLTDIAGVIGKPFHPATLAQDVRRILAAPATASRPPIAEASE